MTKKVTGYKMDISKLNSERNEYMDEIIDIEEVQHPAFYRKKMKYQGKMALSTTRKNMLWKRYKELFKESIK